MRPCRDSVPLQKAPVGDSEGGQPADESQPLRRLHEEDVTTHAISRRRRGQGWPDQ